MSEPVTTRGHLALRSLRRVLPVLLVTVVLIMCAIAAQSIDWRQVGHTLAGAHLWMIAVGWALLLVRIAFRAERWRLMLPAAVSPPLAPLFRYYLGAYGFAFVLPPGSTDAMRTYLLKRRHHVPIAPSLAVLAIERLFEGIGLAVIVAPLPLLLSLPTKVAWTVEGLVVGGFCVTAAALSLARWGETNPWISRQPLWKLVTPGIDSLRNRKTFAVAVVLSVLSHLIDCLVLTFVLRSVDLHPPWATAALLTLTLTCAQVVPLIPGNVGPMEVAFASGLAIVGVAVGPALAAALLCHAVQMAYVLVSLGGLRLLAEARAEETASTPGADSGAVSASPPMDSPSVQYLDR